MRRFVQVLALIGTLIVGAAALSLIVSQTAWFRDWLRGYIVRQADEYLEARLSIGRLGGNLFFGIELEDVALTVDGDRVIAIRDVGVDYSVVTFLTRGVVLDDIRINQPVIRLVRDAGGWNVGRLLKEREQEADREGPALPVEIGEIGIEDGVVTIVDTTGTPTANVPERIEGIDARVGFQYEPVRYSVDISHVSFRAERPDLGLRELSGRIAVAGDAVHVDELAIRTRESALRVDGVIEDYLSAPVIKLTASSDKLVIAEFAPLVPALQGYALQPAFELRASGPLDALSIDLDARSEAGNVKADVVADLALPQRGLRGDIRVERLDLAPLLKNPAQKSDLNGRARVDLRVTDGAAGLEALDGTWQIEAPRVAIMGYAARDVSARGRFERGVVHLDGRAAAYGGRATARGTVDPGTPLRLDLRGDAAGVDLRNLPRAWGLPGTPGNLNVSYHVRGAVGRAAARDLTADVVFRRSTLAGATIGQGATARVRLAGARTEYAVDAAVQALDLQQIGRGFGIAALTQERYRTSLNGRIAAEGSGTTLATLDLTARGDLTDSRFMDARLQGLEFEARVVDRDVGVRAAGAFSELDPGALGGRPQLAGHAQGLFDIDATVRRLGEPLTPESISASGSVTVGESRIGGIPVTSVALKGTFDRGAGTVESLRIDAPDLQLDASGPIDLRAGGGSSNLQYRADIGRLETFAALADVPLSGTAQLEGRLTGNGSTLATDGTLQASNIHYGEHSVLSARTTYGVRLPDLQPARAEVSVNGSATLLQVAGRELAGVELDATWHDQAVRFRTTVTESQRSVTAAGDVVLHPDHQEVHLTDLALRANGTTWQTPQGTETAIRYGGGRVAVDHLQLESGAQRIAASGTLGRDGGALHVNADAVDLAALDQLALGEQRFGGTLTANATITGTTDAPEVEATFTVRDGSFRDYRYQALDGTVAYTTAGIQLDARLTQNPQAWITAKGFVPAAILRPAQAAATAGEHREPPAGQGLDVTVRSSELDLALVQGFVPQLSRVSGTLVAEVRATGAADDPHLNGFVEIRNGAFTVADLTKGGYTGLDTRITLEPDRVVIDRLRLLDEHRNWLEIDGQIAVHERQVGQVAIALRSSEFELIDNQLADIKVDTDLQVAGRLQQPRITGKVGVHTGTVRLDRIFSDLMTDAYALTPTDIESAPQTAISPSQGATAKAAAGESPKAPETTETPEEPAGSAFQGMALDVELTVPNNLVIRGTGLNPGGTSPIALGDVNVTVGGSIRAQKTAGARDVSVVGTVNTVRGTYDFQGRRFEIERDGRIQFTGATPIDPRLDITARRVISGVEAFVHVRGTARAPELQLSSRPPQDEADILSLIVFGQPANSLGEGQQLSLAERAGALATGFVASSLAQSIGNAFEIDVFEVQTSADAGGGGAVTIGEQVGERLFVRFRQGFGAQSMSEFILEYQLTDYLRLQTSLAEGTNASQRTLMRRVEQGGIDLIFFFSY